GEPVNDRLDQSDKDLGAILDAALRAIAARHINGEGSWVGVAHRDETLAGENESNRRGSGLALLGLINQRRRHEIRAAFLIKSARDLNLLLLLTGRHLDLESSLDLGFFLLRGIEKIDPDRL